VYFLYFYAPWFYMDALFWEKDWLDDRHFSTFFTSQRLHLSSKELKCIFPEKVAQIQGYHKFLFYTYPFIFFTESFWSQVSYFVRKWSESHLIKKRFLLWGTHCNQIALALFTKDIRAQFQYFSQTRFFSITITSYP